MRARSTAVHVAATLGARALDWVYPPVCLVCEEPTEAHGGLCAACWRGTRFVAGGCPRCGSPAGEDLAVEDVAALRALAAAAGGDGPLCGDCPPAPFPLERMRAATVYDGAARDLVLALKRGDRLEAAAAMARPMAAAANRAPAMTPALLVPAAAHWTRRLARRFDPAAEIATATARALGWPLGLGALRRVRRTPSSQGRDAATRRADLAEAFVVPPRWRARIEGRPVTLVDDVATSGATLASAAVALRDAGASRVEALVFARTTRGERAQRATS